MSDQNNDNEFEIRRLKDRIGNLEGEVWQLRTAFGNLRWAFIWSVVLFVLYVWVSR